MKTLTISVSDLELNKFGIKKEQLSFSEFVDIVSKELVRQNLSKSIELAEKYGLSKLSMEDITKEVKAVRGNAKNHS
jgi:predicted CopG family antitoxin